MQDTHQGYANYATFGAAVTFKNDRRTYEAINEYIERTRAGIAQDENVRENIWTEDQALRFRLADDLKARAETACELAITGGPVQLQLIASQMAQAGLSEVDWEEVAEDFLSE